MGNDRTLKPEQVKLINEKFLTKPPLECKVTEDSVYNNHRHAQKIVIDDVCDESEIEEGDDVSSQKEFFIKSEYLDEEDEDF